MARTILVDVQAEEDPSVPSGDVCEEGGNMQCRGGSPAPPPPVSRRDLVHKTRTLRAQLAHRQRKAGYCRITVSRENVFEDSYRHVPLPPPLSLSLSLSIPLYMSTNSDL